ncbi:MAG: ATP-binding protein [Motiliproteus sp.]|nr:ATP-binding protein [Motiliproteus sp.]
MKQGEQRWLSLSLVDSQLPVDQWTEESGFFDYVSDHGKTYLGLNKRFENGDQVTVVEDISSSVNQLQNSHLKLTALAILAILLLLFLQKKLIRSAFSSLDSVKKGIDSLHKDEEPRLHQPEIKEVAPLVDAINQLLSYLDSRAKRNRHLVGDLSHAMKTPLSVIRQLAERNNNGLSYSHQQLLLEQTDKLADLVEKELKRARITGRGSKSHSFSMESVTQELAETVGLIYPQKALDIELEISSDSCFPGERSDYTEMIGNLLDNAGKWCQKRVLVTSQCSETELLIRIEDDGPGCSGELIHQLLDRGVRADESKTGHGLGLSIVAAIVQQYDGGIEIDRSQGFGGAQITISLPLI